MQLLLIERIKIFDSLIKASFPLINDLASLIKSYLSLIKANFPLIYLINR